MKIENLVTDGFEAAFRGMRNPLDSWNKSDSQFGFSNAGEIGEPRLEKVAEAWIEKITEDKSEEEIEKIIDTLEDRIYNWLEEQGVYDWDNINDDVRFAYIGPNDMGLAQRLINAGPEHCKFLRQIQISFDITAPFYWWKEFDTYKVGTTANSCSTMHTIHKKPFTFGDFETEYMISSAGETFETMDWLNKTLDLLNYYRQKYLGTKDKMYWYQLIKILPESYLQKRTITMNYAVLRNIIKQRQGHKLNEWKIFIDAMKELPYAKELIFYGLEKEENK